MNVNDKDTAPEWLERLLAECVEGPCYPASQGFSRRCLAAAHGARDVSALRATAHRVGFEALSWSQYVRRVAHAAGVAIRPVLELMGMTSPDQPAALDKGEWPAVRLAAEMQVPLRQLLAHISLGFFSNAGVPIGQVVRYRSGEEAAPPPIADVERGIEETEQSLDPSIAMKHRKSRERVASLYEGFGRHRS